MTPFFEKQVEVSGCRLYIKANDSSATLTIEQIPEKYKSGVKCSVVNCFIYDWDADRLEGLSNSLGLVFKEGVEKVATVLKEQSKVLFGEDYSITCKDVDCFCIKPLSGYGFRVSGDGFSGYCTYEGIRLDDGSDCFSCSAPEEVKPVFRSIATCELKFPFNGDIESFIGICKNVGCNIEKEE